MKINKIINEYVECDLFEIRIINKKVKIYYYDKLLEVTNEKIVIIKDNNIYTIKGNNMVIETLYKEQIVISGKINNIVLGKK